MEKLKTKEELVKELLLYSKDCKMILLQGNKASIDRFKNLLGENPCIDVMLFYKEKDNYYDSLEMYKYDGSSIIEELYHHIGFENPLHLRILNLLDGENTDECRKALYDILHNYLDSNSTVTLNKN